MLIRYKKLYEKIAMGLLSYTPGGSTVKMLQEAINIYETNDQWQLFLWKKEEDFIGLVGIENIDEASYKFHHISVNPSFRGEGVGKEMVKKLQQQFPEQKCVGTEDTDSFIQRFTSKEEGAD